MSSNTDNIVPNKNDIMINPKTNRPIKIGGRAWTNLVRDGLVSGNYQDSNELYEIKEDDNVDEKIKELNQNLPLNVQSVRGRGKYKNKLVKRFKQPSTKDITKHTARKTAHKLKDRKVYEQLHETNNFENELEQMIMSELSIINSRQPTKIRKVKGSLKQRQHQNEYHNYNEEPEHYESESESESESEFEEYE